VVDLAWEVRVRRQRLRVGWIDWHAMLRRGLVGSWEPLGCMGCVEGTSAVVALLVLYFYEVCTPCQTVTGWSVDYLGARKRSVEVGTPVL
jgi:hypothetical protein